MKLNVFEIPEDGMEFRVSADDKGDSWFRDMIEGVFCEDYPKGNPAVLDLYILRTGDNVQMSGTAEVHLRPTCGRCTESFDQKLTVPLQVNLVPRKGMELEGTEDDDGLEDGLDGKDVAFSFYKGEQIDAGELVREILMLGIPIRYLCEESCKGLCAQCGSNLNGGDCSCSKKAPDPRLAVLGTLLKMPK